MCKAFSCIVGIDGKVYWKTGIDSHEDIITNFKLKEKEEYMDGSFGFRKCMLCKIEITPSNKDYISSDKWELKFDDGHPDWWKVSHEKHAFEALEKWKKEVYSKLYIKKIKNIIHPFKLPMVKKVNKSQINLLRQWDSVWDSVRDSVWDSVRDSVWDSVGVSVWDSVWASVWDSVRDSVWDSVWDSVGVSVWDSVGVSVWDSVWVSVRDSVGAYVGSMFKLKRSEWKYTDKIKCKGYPFMPLVKLWKQGLVPSFDGNTWRLHSGEKAKIVYEIKKDELIKGE